ncbi:hypothetical protein T09_6372 [Trichinella sp. T9]|nr:hypothetical protein T09_6372 [Trichinella sp. T9]
MYVASRDVAVIVTTAVAHPRPLVSPVTRMGRDTMSLRRQGWRCSILDSPGMQFIGGGFTRSRFSLIGLYPRCFIGP